jgi:hypothetical protein
VILVFEILALRLVAIWRHSRTQLAMLGVRTLVDFRLASERNELPNRLAASSGITIVEIGFMAEGVLEMLRAVSRGTVSRTEIEQTFIDHRLHSKP